MQNRKMEKGTQLYDQVPNMGERESDGQKMRRISMAYSPDGAVLERQ